MLASSVDFHSAKIVENPREFAGYTFGYNRPLVSNRVRDILTVIGAIRKYPMYQKVHLVGTGEAGPWVILARALAGDEVTRSIKFCSFD